MRCLRATGVAGRGRAQHRHRCVYVRRKAVILWEQEHDTGERLRTFVLNQLATMPRPVPWVWSHAACALDTNDYEIDADRFDSIGKVLDWTLHLLDKPWFAGVAWMEVVRRFYHLPDA